MTKKQKRLQRIRNNPKAVRYDALLKVLDDFGFEVREGKGSHTVVYRMIEGVNVSYTVAKPHGKHVKPVQVRVLLKYIDQIIESEEPNDDDND